MFVELIKCLIITHLFISKIVDVSESFIKTKEIPLSGPLF